MKHLLIILISILLLSSPLFGQETGVLYLWDTSSGQVWKTFGDSNLVPKYEGEIKNGKPDGLGTLYNGWMFGPQVIGGVCVIHFCPPNDVTGKCTTIGEWKNGKLDGHATSTWGSFKQKGEWRYGIAWNTKEYSTTRENVITSKTINGISKSWNTYRYGIDKKIEGEWVNGVFHKIVKNSNGKCLRLSGAEVRCEVD